LGENIKTLKPLQDKKLEQKDENFLKESFKK